MKTVIVISNKAQLTAWKQHDYFRREVVIYCDNARFYEILEMENISYMRLDEFLIRDQWEAINVWGCAQASKWIRTAREHHHFSEFDFPF